MHPSPLARSVGAFLDHACKAAIGGNHDQRSLRLPDTVDQDKVEASFDNGVLKIKVPKRPEAIGKQRTIPITKR